MWLIENFYSKPKNNLIFYVILQCLKNIMKALKRPFPWFTVEILCWSWEWLNPTTTFFEVLLSRTKFRLGFEKRYENFETKDLILSIS